MIAAALPLIACLATPVLARWFGRNAGWILAGVLISAAGLLLVADAGQSGNVSEYTVPWIPALGVEFALRLDGLALMFSLIVLLIGAAVLIYSVSYLKPGESITTFYLLMMAFASSMLLLVLADDLIVMLVAWEATTFCSFFLISRSGANAREPAIRTLLVTALGGLSLLSAVGVMIVTTGTTSITQVLADPAWAQEPSLTATVVILLAVAAFTKSAQFPFQSWLPDSMVAITPVSAYLHAAAMVKAGVYLLFRFSPAFSDSTWWTCLLLISGLITALLGAVSALRRHDLKELLAHSTVSQLGLLVAMIGIGTPTAFTAAAVHTIAHALFKSSLFMLVGVIDHQAGTRDIRELARLRIAMPWTAAALGLAGASMAGIPPLLGFVSKESMYTSFLEAPWPSGMVIMTTVAVALTSVLTLAYSARILLGAFGRRSGTSIPEATALFLIAPLMGSIVGVALGLFPAILDVLMEAATTATTGETVRVHLAIWHGFTTELLITGLVFTAAFALVIRRKQVDRFLEGKDFPFSGLGAIDSVRQGIIRWGAKLSHSTGGITPHRHLAIPIICLTVVAIIAMFGSEALPERVSDFSQPLDWVLVILIAAGVLAAVRAQTRIAAIVVVGVVGFSMTLWFFTLGATDVALTQLLVEVLTVCVMVLVLERLPKGFSADLETRRRLPAIMLAAAAGIATTLGVMALTGRRDTSAASAYYLDQGELVTGGANVVNTILVDFRALDTLGELTVLGVAGIAIAALLHGRSATVRQPVQLREDSPIADASANAVFAQTASRALGPMIVLFSIILFFRGHQEPGGGFIAALIGGAGFALVYLAAPHDRTALVRWPYRKLIGAGVLVATATGFIGFAEGSFLEPLHITVFGLHLTTALLFDLGVYLAVIGIVLAALNLLGLQPERSPATLGPEEPGTPETNDAASPQLEGMDRT